MQDTAKFNIQKMSRKMGTVNAQRLLEILAKDKQFVDALETDTGQELLKDAVEQIQKRIELIIEEKDTPEIRAEIRAYRSIVDDWTKSLSRYSKNLNKATQKGT